MSVAQYLAPVLLMPALAVAGTGYDSAKVVGAEPVYESVSYTVPVEQCKMVEVPNYDEHSRRSRSYTAPIVGAIIGGAIGNAVGHNKTNKKVGTAVGAILGGSIGRDISRGRDRGSHHSHDVGYHVEEVCETIRETHEELKLTGYEVRYRYAGRTHTTYMVRDPGKFVKVRVEVTPV